MSETLYTSEEVVLFGRVVTDIAVTEQVAAQAGGTPTVGFHRTKRLVRVYGFTFDGIYYEMTTPILYMVDKPGVSIDKVAVPGPNPLQAEFVKHLKAWTVNRNDRTIRLDVESGRFEQVLLDVLNDGGGGGVSGARVSGARVSGARVSGARVSGARVSGARVSGARVSGGGDASD
ncbi:MAG: pentapeptide repeat-containing protein [Pseudomonadota bacterium]